MSEMYVEEIRRFLPHRYPFLLVDRVLECVPGESLTAIKNVSVNEPFFTGHFPETPIMPGVLVLEAMAQAGGVLMLNAIDDPEKYVVYFMGIDNARFRKPVTPGDQLRFELTMGSFRRNICKMNAKAYVEDDLVAGADFMAMVVER